MLLTFILFWILIVWGLKECDLYPIESGIYAAIWVILLIGFTYPATSIPAIIGMVILDAVLLFKVLGQNVKAFE